MCGLFGLEMKIADMLNTFHSFPDCVYHVILSYLVINYSKCNLHIVF